MEEKIVPDISFVVVNYFSDAYTEQCLSALAETAYGMTYDIWIIDNSSTLKPDALARNGPQVQLLRPGKNLGYGAACHLGAQQARGRYLCFLNNDTKPLKSAIPALYQFMETHPRAGLIGPQHLDAQGKKVCSFDYFPTLASKLFGMGVLKLTTSRPLPSKNKPLHQPTQVELVSGACLFMRAELYRRIGGFDREFFLYCEEEDLALRVHEQGFQAFLIPAAELVHVGGGSSKDTTALKREFYISFFKFYRKHYGVWKTAVLKAICMNQFALRWLLKKDKAVWAFLIRWMLRGAPENESLRYAPGNLDA